MWRSDDESAGGERGDSLNLGTKPNASEEETWTYNAAGQMVTRTDCNGNVHTYSCDVLGRTTADAGTTLGSGVDGAVRRLEFSYDTAGGRSSSPVSTRPPA